MLLIMNMVKANSQLALVHAQILEVDHFLAPIFAQLVHNTDDDSLLLLLITDFRSMEIKEIHLGHYKSAGWALLSERYGNGNQTLVTNVNTMFLTLEFKNMLKRNILKLDKHLQHDNRNQSLVFDSTLNSPKVYA